MLAISTLADATGQEYFKISAAIDRLDQKVAEFRNGDLLIGNSSTASLRTGDETGILILKRIDNCGNSIWAREYSYDGGYLILKDIAVNKDDEIFMYGSHYKGLIESIFISKIENQNLDIAEFRIFDPGSVDHFTYTMDLNNDRLLIYGLLLDFNTSKEGFIGLFDQNLNLQSASKFFPFESTGEAVLSQDGSIVGRSGPFIYRFDEQSNLEWAFTTIDQQDLLNIGGPFNVSDGHIMESHNGGFSFLYKLDHSGNLIWTSDRVEKSNSPGDLKQMSDGHLLFVYNHTTQSGTELSFLILNQQGVSISEKRMTHGYSMNTGVTKQRIRGERVNVIGSKNLFSTEAIEIENFILQLQLDAGVTDCYAIEDAQHVSPNPVSVQFNPIPVVPEAFDLLLIDRLNLKSSLITDDLTDICARQDQSMSPMIESKRIPCEDVWEVSLPSEEFRWDDGFDQIERVLSTPGIYTARSKDCLQQEFLEFSLEKEECGCHLYVPNVFSPNGDDTNDVLQFGIFCELESLEVSIFNLWGELVYTSQSKDSMWSGKIRDQDAPLGTYSVYVKYAWLDTAGQKLENTAVQAVTLVR